MRKRDREKEGEQIIEREVMVGEEVGSRDRRQENERGGGQKEEETKSGRRLIKRSGHKEDGLKESK